MSHLFALTIKPGESGSYVRLMLVIYLLTVGLINYSSLPFFFKLILICLIALQLRLDWKNKSPDNGIKDIQFSGNKWSLTLNDDKKRDYDTAQVLIHNPLFQLLQFKSLKQKKFVILFNDQVSNNQLRLVHLLIAQNKGVLEPINNE